MGRSRKLLCCTTASLLAFFLVPARTAQAGLSQSMCSRQNTAAGDARFDIYMSNGACYNHCKGQYALAIVQGKQCWCSDYIPEEQADTDDCNEPCPGYPDERCGNEDDDLFGYIPLEKKPSGTQPVAKPTSAKPSLVPPSSVSSLVETPRNPETVVKTVYEAPPAVISTHSEKLSTSTVAPGPTTEDTSKPAATTTEAPKFITVSGPGGLTTIVQTPTAGPTTTPAEKKGTSVGAIVGGVVGGLFGLALLVGAVIFALWRRRRRQQEEEEGQFGVQRHTSQMSKSGLIRTEKVPRYPPPIATNVRRSSRMMQDSESISPMESGSDRRSSRPYIFDQRLNPSAIMTLDNASRASVVSMDDSRDYGRTLNVRNPDPVPDPG